MHFTCKLSAMVLFGAGLLCLSTANVQADSITPFDPAYKNKGQVEFTGHIEKVSFKLTP
jgi:hypothetical protein